MRALLEMSRDPQHWPYVDLKFEMRECEHWMCETAKYLKALAGRPLKRRFRPTECRPRTPFETRFVSPTATIWAQNRPFGF